jgi:hypothetical protein
VVFTRQLRDGVRSGAITCSIRIWQRQHVVVGNRYRVDEGEIEVDSVLPIQLSDITPELARESGFKGVVDLLKVAKHGPGESVFLIRFHYIPPAGVRPVPPKRKVGVGPPRAQSKRR